MDSGLLVASTELPDLSNRFSVPGLGDGRPEVSYSPLFGDNCFKNHLRIIKLDVLHSHQPQ